MTELDPRLLALGQPDLALLDDDGISLGIAIAAMLSAPIWGFIATAVWMVWTP